jgi:3D (Asp-Asp-Asp) domain-containing protein
MVLLRTAALLVLLAPAWAFSSQDREGIDIHWDDPRYFDRDLPPVGDLESRKKIIPQFLAPTCETIRENLKSFPVQKISKSTQYFTPMFEPGADGKLQEKDRVACIMMEGSCIVGSYLYNWTSKSDPWGKLYVRDDIKFIFGKGSGEGYYNTTNALDPCRTLAADENVYPAGTVIYIPSMRDKICPQSGKPVDGCFVVGDVGGAIKGKGRFDIFTGECANYDKSNSTCADALNNQFVPEAKGNFHVIGKHNKMAKAVREETDMFINNRWSKRILP